MTIREFAAHWLREPLVHFLAAGALVYVVLSGRPPDPGERRIVVDEQVVGRLVNRWVMTFRRQPTPDEIDGLIREYVSDQVYYREGLRLGLDRDDEVVVRRMRNKMVAMATSDAEAEKPSDAQLQKLLDADPAKYARDPSFTFEQVYLGADTPQTRALAARVLVQLKQGQKAISEVPPSPLPGRFDAASASDLAAQFGDDFPDELRPLKVGDWTGPLASGLGLHLVRVERQHFPAPPKVDDVRQRLENDWRDAAIKKAEQEAYRRILKGYDVEIVKPE